MGAQAVSLAVSTLLFITFTCCTDWQLMALADTEYVVINNALNESGGQKFESEVGETKAQSILTSATQFIRNTFGYDAGNPSKVVDKVTLYVDDEPTQGVVAFTSSDVSGTPNAYEIHYSQNYVDSLNGVEGVLYHEMTHVWQWNGQGTADGGLIEGIADYVRLTAGLPASGWGQPGEGNKWDDGYDVTAYFLQYCESLRAGFVADLNAKLASGWDVAYFNDLLGQSVDELWNAYKQKYAR